VIYRMIGQAKPSVVSRPILQILGLPAFIHAKDEGEKHIKMTLTSIPTGNAKNNPEYAMARAEAIREEFKSLQEELGEHNTTGQPVLTIETDPKKSGDGDNFPHVDVVAEVDEQPFLVYQRLEILVRNMRSVTDRLTEIEKGIESHLELSRGTGTDARNAVNQLSQDLNKLSVHHGNLERLIGQLDDLGSTVNNKINVAAINLQERIDGPTNRLRDQIAKLELTSSVLSELKSEIVVATQQNDRQEEQTPKKRPLMDYLYFMIYTTTTTGYGDLRPSSTFAKFTVSVANIIEVFFVVVFFNLVIAALKWSGKNFTNQQNAASEQSGKGSIDQSA
ncbi:MAG: hypothetical protein LGR52_07565, partial [Candidatus Thiosymbion ectosymbiont of Robbea hypermnestra]|nr:hypothetical protein [Candidatus Thiosymbion ectosymbiont of Robbea hypermnestra]